MQITLGQSYKILYKTIKKTKVKGDTRFMNGKAGYRSFEYKEEN
jgi:hypothetical protein